MVRRRAGGLFGCLSLFWAVGGCLLDKEGGGSGVALRNTQEYVDKYCRSSLPVIANAQACS